MATSELRFAPAPPARPEVEALPAYRPGRSAADALADHGVAGAVKLASNELPWPPVPAALDAYEAALAGLSRYPDARATALRAALADHLGVDPTWVCTGPGAVGLLQQLALAYVRPGDEVVRGEPSFEAYPIFTRLAGGIDVAVPAAGHRLDLGAMAAAVGPATRLVLVAEPNNPTGTAAAGRLEQVAGAAGAECLVVLDGAYHEFTDEPHDDEALRLALARPNVVALRTFSKAHGLAALRVGYLVAHPDVVAALDKVAIPFAVGTAAQEAAVASLRSVGTVEARVAALREERRRVREGLLGLGLEVPESQTNFLWLPLGERTSAAATALEREGIVTRPFPGQGLRITIGTPEQDDRLLRAASAVLAP